MELGAKLYKVEICIIEKKGVGRVANIHQIDGGKSLGGVVRGFLLHHM